MSLTKFYFSPLTGNSHDRARCVSFFSIFSIERTNEKENESVETAAAIKENLQRQRTKLKKKISIVKLEMGGESRSKWVVNY